jgi:hypothetical protein
MSFLIAASFLFSQSSVRFESDVLPVSPEVSNEKSAAAAPADNPKRLLKSGLEKVLEAGERLRAERVFEATRLLDLVVVLPVDSYGITRFMHSNGINCRYLGLMYEYSTAFHVRQLILCESIARAVKVLMNQLLRHTSRRGRAMTMLAEQRRRSKESHFIDYQQALLKAKSIAVVDTFNIVMGCSPKSADFWSGESFLLIYSLL